MQNRNNLTPQQLAYLQVLFLRIGALNALEFATFLKLLDLETLNRSIAICEWKKAKQAAMQNRKEQLQQRMFQMLRERQQQKQKRKAKATPKRCTIAEAWEKRRLERLRVKKKLPLTIEIDTTVIMGSNSSNRRNTLIRRSPLISQQVKDSLKRYASTNN